jgi:hypothetical protein
MNRGDALARELAKLASSGAGKAVGAVLRQAARGAKNVVKGSGEFGAGVAEGLGADPGVGRIVGMGAAVGAGAAGAGRAKRKVDEFRYRNGLYSQY